MAKLIDGTVIAGRIRQQLIKELSSFTPRPQLCVLYCNSLASLRFWSVQRSAAASLDIHVQGKGVPTDVTQGEIERIIQAWNGDSQVHGIFVHQPLPSGIDAQRLSALIDPHKDVEGVHPANCARRFFAKARIGSCTALAVMELIESTGVSLAGKEAVVVGHSEIVGRPVSMLLLDKLATTTICHVGTDQAGRLEEHVRNAEVLVVAVGKPKFIPGEWIKPGSIVIDVGINVVGGRVVGDVEYEGASQRAAYISPVPGGVGPVTVLMVMKNTVEAFKLQRNNST